MQIAQLLWTRQADPVEIARRGDCRAPQLVLVFAAPAWLREAATWRELQQRFPTATIVAGSTAGEIYDARVVDDSLVATAVQFDKTTLRQATISLAEAGSSRRAGEALIEQLSSPGLAHVFVLSDGLKVNGSELVAGLRDRLPEGVGLSGGLCADGPRFEQTHVCVDRFDADARVVALGFYGKDLRTGLGSLGGWDSFGPERRVTRAVGNVVYELDGKPALDLYEQYLGEHATGLPASGLLFPLMVRADRNQDGIVRTILAVDGIARSLTFAGDVPTGHFARLMRANFDRLVEGAAGAAHNCRETLAGQDPELAILISCVGRKLVLKQRIEEEVEAVQRVLGASPVLAGFYSYGEISPFASAARCELHNQTMTITTFSEH